MHCELEPLIIALISDKPMSAPLPSTAPSGADLPAILSIAPELAERIARYGAQAEGAFSPNTIRAFRSDVQIFVAWCSARGVPPLPASPETVAAFVRDMAVQPLPDRKGRPQPDPTDPTGFRTRKSATIRRCVSSIDHLHRAAELSPPGATNAVRLAVRALNRAKGTRQRQAKPMRLPQLRAALDRMGASLIDLRDAALLGAAYDTGARGSELGALRLADVESEPDGSGSVLIRRSKTDQEGEGSVRYLSADTMARIAAWREAARLEPDAFLFPPLSNRGEREHLSADDVRAIIKRRVGTSYSAHSTRVGAAQDARAAGASTGALQSAYGWKSDRMPARYTERLAAQDNAAAALARAQGR